MAENQNNNFGLGSGDIGQLKIIYILLLAGLVTGGLASLVGVVMAYMNRGEADEMASTHYTWQIRTFWISLLYWFVSAILAMALIGFLLMVVVLVWYIVRCVKGFQALDKGEPIANVESWLF